MCGRIFHLIKQCSFGGQADIFLLLLDFFFIGPLSFPEPWGMKGERSTRSGLASPIEGARPGTGFSLASAWLYPPAFQTLQVPGTHSGQYRLFLPWPRLTPLPPVDGLSLAKETVQLVPGPEYSSHLRPKGMFRAFAWARMQGIPAPSIESP